MAGILFSFLFKKEQNKRTMQVFASFEQWWDYKVNNHPMVKIKPVYHTQNVNRWKDVIKTSTFSSVY